MTDCIGACRHNDINASNKMTTFCGVEIKEVNMWRH